MLNLKKIRKSLSISQKEFSKKIGVSQAYISDVENGKCPASDNFLLKVKEIFGVNTEDYLSWNKKKVLKEDAREYINLLEKKVHENENDIKSIYKSLVNLQERINKLEQKNNL